MKVVKSSSKVKSTASSSAAGYSDYPKVYSKSASASAASVSQAGQPLLSYKAEPLGQAQLNNVKVSKKLSGMNKLSYQVLGGSSSGGSKSVQTSYAASSPIVNKRNMASVVSLLPTKQRSRSASMTMSGGGMFQSSGGSGSYISVPASSSVASQSQRQQVASSIADILLAEMGLQQQSTSGGIIDLSHGPLTAISNSHASSSQAIPLYSNSQSNGHSVATLQLGGSLPLDIVQGLHVPGVQPSYSDIQIALSNTGHSQQRGSAGSSGGITLSHQSQSLITDLLNQWKHLSGSQSSSNSFSSQGSSGMSYVTSNASPSTSFLTADVVSGSGNYVQGNRPISGTFVQTEIQPSSSSYGRMEIVPSGSGIGRISMGPTGGSIVQSQKVRASYVSSNNVPQSSQSIQKINVHSSAPIVQTVGIPSGPQGLQGRRAATSTGNKYVKVKSKSVASASVGSNIAPVSGTVQAATNSYQSVRRGMVQASAGAAASATNVHATKQRIAQTAANRLKASSTGKLLATSQAASTVQKIQNTKQAVAKAKAEAAAAKAVAAKATARAAAAVNAIQASKQAAVLKAAEVQKAAQTAAAQAKKVQETKSMIDAAAKVAAAAKAAVNSIQTSEFQIQKKSQGSAKVQAINTNKANSNLRSSATATALRNIGVDLLGLSRKGSVAQNQRIASSVLQSGISRNRWNNLRDWTDGRIDNMADSMGPMGEMVNSRWENLRETIDDTMKNNLIAARLASMNGVGSGAGRVIGQAGGQLGAVQVGGQVAGQMGGQMVAGQVAGQAAGQAGGQVAGQAAAQVHYAYLYDQNDDGPRGANEDREDELNNYGQNNNSWD